MKAALLEAQGKISVQEMALPACGAGEVLIQVKACGLCRTDLKCFELGQRDLVLPRVLGHEISGIVAQVGKGVENFSPGDRVQAAPGISCGTCPSCQKGEDHLCDTVKILGFHLDGGFAEYVLIPAAGVQHGAMQKIPDHLAFDQAALTEPLACAVNMQEKITVGSGDTVLIIGAGPLGILNAKLARLRGAEKIILLEEDEKRCQRAAQFDFDSIINTGKKNGAAQVRLLTEGKGADVVIPCCPGMTPFSLGMNALARGGRMGFFSGITGDTLPGFDMNRIHYRELKVAGAYGCSTGHNRKALKLIADGRVEVKSMITRHITLEEVRPGLAMIKERSQCSIIMMF